jgi:dipeptidyl-peptidase-4
MMTRTRTLALTIAIAAGCLAAMSPVVAQRATLTAADYARAEKFLAPSVQSLMVGGAVTPTWLPDERFWFRDQTLTGTQIVMVDPAKRTRTPYADCPAAGVDCTAEAQPTGRGPRGGLGAAGRDSGPQSSDGKPLALSPDRSRAVFVRDWNLWLRDQKTGEERALTTDGIKDFGYATDNAGWAASDRAIVSWSPDSTKIATQQQDERKVGEMYLVNTTAGHPTLRVSKFPLPGDPAMAMLQRVVIDAVTGKITRLQMEPDFHRGTLGDNISMEDYRWSPDGSKLALASVSRDHQHVWLRVADTATGAVRTVFDETVATQFEARAGWRVLWNTNEFVWYSERDNWGQLYLHDLQTGALKRQITTGEGPVMQIARLDEQSRTLWFGANGRERGQDPYFLHFYRVSVDGGPVVSLTPEDGTHAIQMSPSGKYLIDTWSKPDVPPVVVLRDAATGASVLPLAQADISKLLAIGWKPPLPIKMMAHDGKTDIYGSSSGPRTSTLRRSIRSSTTSIRDRRPAAPAAAPSPRRAAIAKPSPSSASSSSPSTGWGRRGDRRRSRTRTTARWDATTRFRIRSRG